MDPTAWLGLLTLVILEIVLGIDNLVFIAILADKLPARQRDRARLIGLGLALLMRLVLLASISWLATLTEPFVRLGPIALSGRDFILLLGGVFLLFKGTMELHERLEGGQEDTGRARVHAGFWLVVAQIVVLDAVFSLDAVITAVGMVEHLSVMMIAVIIAIGLMMVASGPLTAFVSGHPTVIVLCLGFLLMIGFSLVVEGFGFHIPKGYLYAAIGFSVLIEGFNQVARRNRQRFLAGRRDLRDRTAETVLRLLGGVPAGGSGQVGDAMATLSAEADGQPVFGAEETSMIRGVLDLAERPIRSIMTPHTEVEWLDLDQPPERLREKVISAGHSRFPVARGSLDNLAGVALTKDILRDLTDTGGLDLAKSVRQPLVIPEAASVLRLIERFRRSPVHLAVVLDEYGSVEGIVTPSDVLAAIAGELPEEGTTGAAPALAKQDDGSWIVDAATDIRHLGQQLGTDLTADTDEYSTLAGYLLWTLRRLPQPGDVLETERLRFEIVAMEGRRIAQVRVVGKAED